MTRPLSVAGLDLSMTATGFALPDGTTHLVKPKTEGDERLTEIRARLSSLRDCDLVAIEDLPANAKSAGITGMVHGAVRSLLLACAVPYVLITPASLKAYATGSGNAGKPEMAVAAFKRAGVEFGDDNQCDAWWLRAMALDHLGTPLFDLPAAQRKRLDAVKWPQVAA
jgi:Holliday junction resolvasome RuvABC endonuclease subunit